MRTVAQKSGQMMPGLSPEITSTLAHHDAAIQNLGGRMTGVETGLRTLQGEVHAGFAAITTNMNTQISALGSKLDKLDAQPKFDFHRTVGTVTTLAVLFSMVCGGIIWITTSQFQITAATVERTAASLSETRRDVDYLREKLGWTARVNQPEGAR